LAADDDNMKLLTGVMLCGMALSAHAESKLKVSDLPPAVQKTVEEQLKDATLVSVGKEVEKGKTLYEVETKVNGKTRDLMVDPAGAVVEVEEEVDIAGIPAAARDAIQKKAAAGTVTKVEALSKSGKLVAYEAAVMKGKKSSEVAVTPEGLPFKD
jgi:uncharacterized membrane protein YkoI